MPVVSESFQIDVIFQGKLVLGMLYFRKELTFFSTGSMLAIKITPSSSEANEGQAYSLSCDIMGDESLDVTQQIIRWDRLTPQVQTSIHDGRVLSFDPLSHDDEGLYRCTTTITSPYLTNTRSQLGEFTFIANRKLSKTEYSHVTII